MRPHYGMRYYIIRGNNEILVIHKIYDSAVATFSTIAQDRETYMELVQITVDGFGGVIKTLILQSYAKDTGTITHMICIHAPT